MATPPQVLPSSATSAGEVSVTARVTQGGQEAAVKISVTDTGCGFSEEVGAKLFGRFEQGDSSVTRRYGGAGLGLSIARGLARMMGGDIHCSARPGEGATFVFTARLAVASGAAVEATAAAGPAAAASGARRLRILLAEDHLMNQKVVQLMIGEAADLCIVGDGAEALEFFALQGPFDVHLPKPITADGLGSAIERALELAGQAAKRTQGAGRRGRARRTQADAA